MVTGETRSRKRVQVLCKLDANWSPPSARTGPVRACGYLRAPSPPDFTYLSSTMVRLITHNLLACHAKGCTSNNFPLQFKDVQVELREAEFNPDFLRGFIPRLEWGALVDAARQVRFSYIDVHAERNTICLPVG